MINLTLITFRGYLNFMSSISYNVVIGQYLFGKEIFFLELPSEQCALIT